MGEFTQEQLDAAVKEAVDKATSEMHSKSDMDAAIAKAVKDAMSKISDEHNAALKLAVDQEKSKRGDIEKRLKEANKKQIPTALDGLDDDVISVLLEVAQHTKGWNDQKLKMFLENVATGNYQNVIVQQRQSWLESELKPKDDKIAELEAELSTLKREAIVNRKSKPLNQAVLAHCNPDPYAQEDAQRRIDAMFEDELVDGKFVPKQIGSHLGIDPQTNETFAPETAAKYLARTINHLRKPSSTSDHNGNGKSIPEERSTLPLSEQLKGKTAEQKRAILAARKK